jgi:transcriptional regulator with XRE-family HTH domain
MAAVAAVVGVARERFAVASLFAIPGRPAALAFALAWGFFDVVFLLCFFAMVLFLCSVGPCASETCIGPQARKWQVKPLRFHVVDSCAKHSHRCAIALSASASEYGRVPGTALRSTRNIRTSRERTELWQRVGHFVRQRREELGLSQGDVIRVLGYKSRNAVSNIEIGIEGLPAKRAYAWADLLEVPRDAFFEFVTGQRERLEVAKTPVKPKASDQLTSAEEELLARYRQLPPKFQRRLREHAGELEILARAEQRRGS